MTSSQGITRDNHYVPQLYLKHWSNNGNTVCTYNGILRNKAQKAWRNTSIKKSGYQRDFYTDIIDGFEDDKIERYFKGIEDSAVPVFKKIRDDEAVSDSELSDLIEYMIAQLTRTPAFFNYSNEIVAANIDSNAQSACKALETTTKDDDRSERLTQSLADKLMPISGSLDGLDVTIEVGCGRSMFISSALRFRDGEMANLFRNLHWHILTTDQHFLTCDNPVVLLRRNVFNRKWTVGLKGTPQDYLQYIYMPLTPQHVLIAKFPGSTEEQGGMVLTPNLFRLLQKGIVLNAIRYVYGVREEQCVERWRPPTINQELFDSLDEERRSWNQSNLEIEGDFFPKP